MAWTPNFRRGVDEPLWEWLTMFPGGPSYGGCGNAYDGSRYIYWAVQFGTTAGVGTAGTTQLWRFDTWTDDWQYLATLTSGNAGVDLEYDAVRNVVYFSIGNASTTWGVFNLNTVPVTVANQVIPAWTSAAITLVLPATANVGSSLAMPDDLTVHDPAAANPRILDTGVATAASTATTIVDNPAAVQPLYTQPSTPTTPNPTAPKLFNAGTYGVGQVGLQLRFTSGALAGQARVITAAPSPTSLTVGTAFTAAPAVGDTFVVEVPQNTASAGSTTTVTGEATAAWPVNAYANQDVLIISGTGSGQRKRIASNTATVLTLAAAVTGNPRTGPFTVAPDATSVYRIVPSSDFLYYLSAGGGLGLYRLDVVATTGTAWSGALTAPPAAPSGGANLMTPQAYSPFSLLMFRGAASAGIYLFNMGPNAWVTLPSFPGAETFTTGASAILVHGHRRLWIQKDGQPRCYTVDLATGLFEGASYMPYAAPGGYDGHRSRFIRTADGTEFMYQLRAGGQEFFRVPTEWLMPNT